MGALKIVAPKGEFSKSRAFADALRIAGEHAEDVDRQGRFPGETLAALRGAGSLGWYVPSEFGGGGAPFSELAEASFDLSRRCSASGMVFAMHQIQVACLVHHGGNTPWLQGYLRRIVDEQRLIASATSETGVGGKMRTSIASLEPAGELLQFEKKASTISYGEYADDLLSTVRRNPNADAGDQVLVLTHFSEMDRERMGPWDTLGMRGTCSSGFVVRGSFPAEQVLPVPFSTIAAETMVPVSHILWAHVWLGIATDAFDRAQNFVRSQAKQNLGTTPATAGPLAQLSVTMSQFRALVDSALREYARLLESENDTHLSTAGYALHMNNLKIAASELVVRICQEALRICGFLGFKNGGPYSVGRHLRDAHSAALMIANDRLLSTNSSLLLVHRDTK
jgi:acyl-CoA dehydrogenase